MEWILVNLVPVVLACGADKKRSSLSLGREKGFMAEVEDAERPEYVLRHINIHNNVENIGTLKNKFCLSDKVLVCLRAIAGQEVE